MEIVLIMWLAIGYLAGTDHHFETHKSVDCAELRWLDANDLEVDYCLSKGEIERGEAGIEQFEQDVEHLNTLIK